MNAPAPSVLSGPRTGQLASRPRRLALFLSAGLPATIGVLVGGSMLANAALPPVPIPAENPLTPAKARLGKALFFDEQMSTSNSVACATCHVMGNAGADPRPGRHPGADGVLNNADDVTASPGIISSDAENNFFRDPVFALRPQVTNRSANSPINAAYAPLLFWDGRASGTFRDPISNSVVIASGGALESQASQPPLSNVEMAHASIDWSNVADKIARVNPLDLATNLTPDLAALLATKPSYPDLFQAAFGDSGVTPARIAMAIASYQRTLISDQTPWDRFINGETTALTPAQQQGWVEFQARKCNDCHTAPLFSDNSFRNVGLRPIAQDAGRSAITGLSADAGRFKVPSLRNVGLKTTFMHTGQFVNLGQVMGFYAAARGVPQNAPTRVNRDPLMDQIILPPPQQPVQAQIIDFIANGLRDQRVATLQPPFDKPSLFIERAANQASVVGGGTTGTAGIIPRVVVEAPPMIGNLDFRLGLDGALPGANARLILSSNPAVNGRLTAQKTLPTIITQGVGAGNGYATMKWQLAAGQAVAGQVIFAQWVIDDPGAAGGQAFSSVARIPFFCGSYGCPTAPCGPADIADNASNPVADGQIDNGDFAGFISNFFGSGCARNVFPCTNADIADNGSNSGADGALDNGDFSLFISSFFSGSCGA